MKISIITVCFNSEETIEQTINSVIDQSYSEIEYIIVDGKSTDNTVSIVKKYEDKISKFITEPDSGIYDAMNKGIGCSTGDVIGILNSDDIYMDKNVIQNVMTVFEEKVDCVYGDIVYVERTNTNKVIRYWQSGKYRREKMLYGWMPPHPSFFVLKSVYDFYGLYNTGFKLSADYELMIRILYKNRATIKYLPSTLVKMRVGGEGNLSIKNRTKSNKEDKKAWIVNNLKPPIFLRLLKPLRKIPQFFIR